MNLKKHLGGLKMRGSNNDKGFLYHPTEFIAKQRKVKDLTRNQVAFALQVSVSTYIRIEKGIRKINFIEALLLAKLLCFPVERLVDGWKETDFFNSDFKALAGNIAEGCHNCKYGNGILEFERTFNCTVTAFLKLFKSRKIKIEGYERR